METVALLYEDYQKELAEDFKNTFLKRASDTDSSRSNDTVIDEVTDMLSTNIAVYTEKLLQRWGFSSGGEGGGGGDVTVTLDDLLKKYLSDNYVTIKGDQEVFGEKDFRKGIRIAGRRLYWDEGNDALVIEGAAYTTRWLSAKGVSPGGGGAGSGGAAAMYQLIDVSPNDTKDAVLGAEKDYVLTFDGSFWRGMPNKGGLSSKLFTALDKEGNEVNPDDENAEIYAIRANYSLWSVGFLSAKGISDGGTGGGGGGAVALYQLLDVEKNADITGVAGATKGSVLTFNGDKWYADKPKTAAGISKLFTALDNDGNEVDLNDESKLGTITNIRANYALWSVDWISAKGKSSGGSGGGGGLINLVYGFESLGGTFDNNDNSATFNAFTINEIWKLASSGLTNVTVTGSGNAVTDVIKGSDGRSLTFTKGSTFATKSEFDALNTKFNDFLTGSDADDIINKWSELEVFLQGMKESDNLAVILQSKMDKTAFSKLFTALDASGNEVDPSDDTKTIASIRANFGFWGVDYISAKGVSKGSGGTGGASTLYQLVDVLANDTEDGVEGAAAGKALVFDGTHWRAGDAGLNESQLYSYLTANKYLTQSAADSRYVTSSRKVIAGTGLSGGGALTSDVTLSLGTSGVVAGTYTKVMVDAYGRVTSGTNLSATDIPNLDWSKITTGKPTTLAGYGITDAVTLTTAQTISGRKTFSQNIVFNNNGGITYTDSNVVLRNSDGHTILASFGNGEINLRPNGHNNTEGAVWINKAGNVQAPSVSTNTITIGDAQLVYDSANKALRVKHRTDGNTVGFYSDGWVSALGVKTGGSGVVNTVYSFANLTDGTTFSDSDLDNTFNAYTIKKLYDMAGQGGLDADAMWAELKKADSSKIIDASHIPTSVLDGRWVTLSTNQTITGQKTFTQNILFSNNITGIRNTAGNLVFGAGNENIFCILNDYVGPVETKNNQLVLGNDVGYWKKVTAGQYISKVATGLSPLIVSSNTLVNNLNADLLDGYHQSSFLRADGVNQYVTLSGGDGNNEGYRLVFEGTVTGGRSINSMTLLVNSRHAGTGMISIVFHTINQESTSYVGSLNYYGSTLALGYTMWRLFYNTTTKKVRLFWRFYDYSDCKVSILNSRGLTTNISNKTWYTTIPSDSGSELPSYYNRSDSASSLATSRTLWGQPFNGTANVSGDMTGVGNITMSGQLTSTVASGTAPFIVVSNTVVGNLNADLLDGLHENSFLRHRDTYGIDGYDTLWAQIGIRQYNNAKPDGMANPIYNYGAVISLPGGNTRLDIWYNYASSASDSPTNGIQYRSGWGPDKKPWRMLLDNVNYASYSDGRYVKKAGDTMTGDLTMNNTKGFNIGWSTRVVKTSGNWIHGGGDAASSTDANLRFCSWQGIGWYPTIDSTSGVRQGNNAMWLNVRTGVLDVHSNITSHNGYLAANWDSARRLVLGGGSTYAWINSRNSSNNVLCNIVLQDNKVTIGNYAESSRFVSTVGTGTAPYQCSSTTLNTNLNADYLDGYHAFGQTNAIVKSGHSIGGTTATWCRIAKYSVPNSETLTDVCFILHSSFNNRFAILNIRSRGKNYIEGQLIVSYNIDPTKIRIYYSSDKTGIELYYLAGESYSVIGANLLYSHDRSGAFNTSVSMYRNDTSSPSWSTYVNASTVSLQNNVNSATTLQNTRKINGTGFNGSVDITTSYWGSTRTFYTNSHDSYRASSGVNVNGSSNVTLLLPNSIRCSDWFRSTGNSGWYHENYGGGWYMTDANYIRNYNSKRLRIQTDTYDTIQLVRTSGSGGSSIAFYNGGGTFRGQFGMNATSWFTFDTGTATANQNVVEISPAGGIHSKAEITAKASGSDIRLKKDIQNYNAMNIINRFRSVKYHWNDIAKANSEVYNNDYDQFGLIAQDLIAGGFEQWVRDVFHDYYTVTYERLIPVVWKGLQEVDDEVTKLKREVARLNKRVKELEKSLCA